MTYGAKRWRPWVLEEEEAMPFFRRAVELGINFFDTADMYSIGVSKEITGKALREFANRDEVVLATKVRHKMGDGPNMLGLSRKHIIQSCEASLKRLGLERIDLYQIHRADSNTPIEETLAALDQLVRQGKVLYLGASSMYAWQLMQALSISERNGWAKFASMQNHYNRRRVVPDVDHRVEARIVVGDQVQHGVPADARKRRQERADRGRRQGHPDDDQRPGPHRSNTLPGGTAGWERPRSGGEDGDAHRHPPRCRSRHAEMGGRLSLPFLSVPA